MTNTDKARLWDKLEKYLVVIDNNQIGQSFLFLTIDSQDRPKGVYKTPAEFVDKMK